MSNYFELIDQYCPNGVKYCDLDSLLDYEQPTKYIVNDTNYDDKYPTPVLTAGQSFILGYTNETNGIFTATKEKPVIIFDDFTTSFHWVDFAFKVKSSAMKMLTPKSEDNVFKYIFYAMQCIQYTPSSHSRQWIERYSKIRIPVPPIEVQREIVRILDNFTELTAELTARQKQFNFYRNLLLTFNEQGATILDRQTDRQTDR